jgi:hypothetical protein
MKKWWNTWEPLWQEGKRCVKARGVFSGCRFQIADLMCFLTLTFSYFLWMISLNRYGVYGEISNNQAVSQSFWNWQALALQRPAQKLVEGTRRCWAQRSVGITTLLTILLYWQVWMEMMLKLDFRYNWSLWPKSLKMMYIYISWVSWVLPSPTVPLAIGCSWWPCDDIFDDAIMSCLGFIGHVWDFQKHMDERFPINNSKFLGTLIDYPPNSISDNSCR